MRGMRFFVAAAALLLVAAAPNGERWTRAWTASMWQVPAEQAKTLENVTIRSAVRVGAGGSQLRLRLANDYGPALAIGAATVRLPGGQAVRVTFGGQAIGARARERALGQRSDRAAGQGVRRGRGLSVLPRIDAVQHASTTSAARRRWFRPRAITPPRILRLPRNGACAR